MGTDADISGTPSKMGMALLNPCQCIVWPSTRSGRWESPRLVSVTSIWVSWSNASTGAEICALPRSPITCESVLPVTSRNPKTYMLYGAGARVSGK